MVASFEDELRLRLKPLIPHVSNDIWLIMAELEGVSAAAIRCFWLWYARELAAGRIPLPRELKPYFRTLLGEAGEHAWLLSDNNLEIFKFELLCREWPANKLGLFGLWTMRARLTPQVNELLKALMENWTKHAIEYEGLTKQS